MTGNPRAEPIIHYHRRYDDWFERHRAAYFSELLAVRALLPLDSHRSQRPLHGLCRWSDGICLHP